MEGDLGPTKVGCSVVPHKAENIIIASVRGSQHIETEQYLVCLAPTRSVTASSKTPRFLKYGRCSYLDPEVHSAECLGLFQLYNSQGPCQSLSSWEPRLCAGPSLSSNILWEGDVKAYFMMCENIVHKICLTTDNYFALWVLWELVTNEL